MNAAYAKRAEQVPRPEIELLLACARTRISEESVSRIGRLVGLLTDWDDLISTGNFHGVLPLLYTSLRHVCDQAVPSSPMTELRARFHSNSARNLFLAARLLKILQLLEANGISAVAFKGPTLAVIAYGNLALREFCDLDVLVKEKDFQRLGNCFSIMASRRGKNSHPSKRRSIIAPIMLTLWFDLKMVLGWTCTGESRKSVTRSDLILKLCGIA